MPEKTIRQQPVKIEQVLNVVFVVTGPSLDGITTYRPVDETGTPIGEPRTYTEHFVGPNAVRVVDFLTVEILPNVNAHEGTGEITKERA